MEGFDFNFDEQFFNDMFKKHDRMGQLEGAKVLKDVYDAFKSAGLNEEQVFRIIGLIIATAVSTKGVK